RAAPPATPPLTVPIRLAFAVLVAAGGAIAYLASLGPARVPIALGPALSWEAPLWALAAGACAAGALLAIAPGLIRDRSRPIHAVEADPGEEASASAAEIYREGVDAAEAGRAGGGAGGLRARR